MASEIWYYPSETGPVRRGDLGESFTAIEDYQTRRRETVTSLDSRIYVTDLGGSERVRLLLERAATSSALERACRALVNHLLRGGIVGACLDDSRGWAAPVLGALDEGDTLIGTSGAIYEWLPGSLAADDEIVISSGWPDFKSEHRTVSSITGDDITLATGLLFTYQGSPILVRERNTWIGLRLAEDASETQLFRLGDSGLTFTLDLPLVVDWGAVADHVAAAGAFRGEEGDGEQGLTFEAAAPGVPYTVGGVGWRGGR